MNECISRLAQPPSRLYEAMGKVMEDMTATAGHKLRAFRSRYGSSPAAILTFVASLARTSLECELVQRGGTLPGGTPPGSADRLQRYKPRNDCIGIFICVHTDSNSIFYFLLEIL